MKTMNQLKNKEVIAIGESNGTKVECFVREGVHKLVKTYKTFLRVNGEEVRFPKFATFTASDSVEQAISLVKVNASAVNWK